MLASAVMSAAGSVAGGIRANQQGKYESAVAKNNARLAHQQGEASEEAARKENRDYWRDVSQTKGQHVAAMAANGIDVGFGAASRMIADTELLANEDAAALYKNQANRTRGFAIEGQNYRQEGKAARARGKAAMLGGFMQGATTLAGAAAQYKGQRERLGQKGWF